MTPIRRYWSAGLALLVLLAPGSRARAESALRVELAALARQIQGVLAKRNQSAIAVGTFTSAKRLASSAGPAFQKILVEELAKLNIKDQSQAALEIKGDFTDYDDPKTNLLAVKLIVRILDRDANEIVQFGRAIYGDETVAELLGLTAKVDSKSSPEVRAQQLRGSLDKPAVALHKTRIAAAADSPYAIEVWVKSGPEYQPRTPVEDDEGRAFVPIRRDEVYAVNLINDSDEEAAVALAIDGLSMFAFSAHKTYQYVFVPPKSSVRVDGWHRDNNESSEFKVTEFPKSAAAQLQTTAGIGTITAVFSSAWEKEDDLPEGERLSRSGDATGFGATLRVQYQEAKRTVGAVRASVSVRYTR